MPPPWQSCQNAKRKSHSTLLAGSPVKKEFEKSAAKREENKSKSKRAERKTASKL